jgi:hypothetical protein
MNREKQISAARDTGGMHFAYVDESGDSGATGSRTFSLGCLLVPAIEWPPIFDQVIDFRRSLRDKFKVPVRAEIKANYLLHNRGAFRALGLSESARFAIYRAHLRLVPKLGCKAFAVVIRKSELALRTPAVDCRDVAWEFLLQRLERFMTVEDHHVYLVHDEGYTKEVRKLARKARRAGTAGSAFGSGTLSVPAKRLLDDPVARRSHESYFLQIADLLAFAAYR